MTAAILAWATMQSHAGDQVEVWHAGPSGKRLEGSSLEERIVRHVGASRRTYLPMIRPNDLRNISLIYMHEAWTSSNLLMGRLARFACVPYVIMPHGAYEEEIVAAVRLRKGLRQFAEKRLLEDALRVHLFFESERELLSVIAPAAKAMCIPTGVPPVGARWVGGGGYLAWLGRYDPIHKGLDIVLKALATMHPSVRPYLRMRGMDYRGGKAVVQEMVNSLGLSRSVEVGGEVRGDEKWDFLAQSRAYIHPSRWECHSIALLEALTMGVPTLVSASIHMQAVLEDGGAIIVEGNADAWSVKLGSIGRDDVALREIGDGGYRIVHRDLEWSSISAEWRRCTMAALGALHRG